MKKALSLVLTLALVILSFGTVAASAEGNKTTVTFWNNWTGGDGDVLVALVNKFNAESEDVFIDMTRSTSFENMLQTSLPTNTAADLVLLENRSMSTYEGLLRPMDDIWENTSLKKEDFMSSILETCTYTDGHMYGIPFQISALMMYYNKDLFVAAGLDPEQPPKTYEEWTEYAAKITALSTDEKPVYGSGLYYCYDVQNCAALQPAGGFMINGSGDEWTANLLGNKGLYEGLKWMKKQYAEGYNPVEQDIGSMMINGQIGMMIDGGWTKSMLDASGMNYAMAPIPVLYSDSEFNKTCGNVTCLMLTNSATDETALAAEKFIEWWISTGTGLEAQELTANVDYSNVTPNTEWSVSMFYLNSYLPCVNSAEYQATTELTALSAGEGVTEMYTSFRCKAKSEAIRVMKEMIQSLVFDCPAEPTDEDLDAMLAPYQQELEDALAEQD